MSAWIINQLHKTDLDFDIDALRIVEKGKSGLMQCHGCFVHLSVPWSVPWSASPLRNIGGRILRCTSLAMLLRFSSLIIGD
jgi:hypothetical protein